MLLQLPYSFHLFSYICKLFHHTNVKTNGPDLTKILENLSSRCRAQINPEKPDVPLNKNDAFQKVQKRRVQEKR